MRDKAKDPVWRPAKGLIETIAPSGRGFVMRRKRPKVKGKAAVKAAKRARQQARRGV